MRPFSLLLLLLILLVALASGSLPLRARRHWGDPPAGRGHGHGRDDCIKPAAPSPVSVSTTIRQRVPGLRKDNARCPLPSILPLGFIPIIFVICIIGVLSMFLPLLFSLLPSVFSLLDPREAFTALVKRQALYVCGTVPNQRYSTVPCGTQSIGNCANGGRMLGVGCYFDYQCTPYSGGQPSKCVGGCCCTDPNGGTNNALGFCPSSQRSQVTCTSNAGCSTGQTCNNGLCCTTTGQEYNNACGGLGALSSCTAGSCGSFICSTSNYCCECQFGRSAGPCTNGCPTGYTCSSNGYCCAGCSNGQSPFGVCQNGLCPTGYTCNAGNMCCRV